MLKKTVLSELTSDLINAQREKDHWANFVSQSGKEKYHYFMGVCYGLSRAIELIKKGNFNESN